MFFNGLSDKDLQKIENVGVLRTYREGAYVIREGEGGTSFGVILKGRVEIRKVISGGTYKALVELKEFDLIGELGFFGTPTRSASVVALEETQILEFDKPTFEKFANANPKIAATVYQNMAKILASRLTSNDTTLMDTIIWALGQPREAAPRSQIVQEKPRLRLRDQ